MILKLICTTQVHSVSVTDTVYDEEENGQQMTSFRLAQAIRT